MLTLPITVFFAIAATTPIDTPPINSVALSEVTGNSLFTRAKVELVTYGNPQSPLCNAKIGRPGGVYTCPGPNFTPTATEQCEWHSPPDPGLSSCITFAPPRALPQSIGPDPGGYCILFSGNECKGGQFVLSVGNKFYK